jgi:hypothetical protein
MNEIQAWWKGLDQDHQLIGLAAGGGAFLLVVMIQPPVALFIILTVILWRMK